MESSYLRISAYRTVARAVCTTVVACPAAEAALISALTVEAAIQEIIKTYWKEQAQVWNHELSNRCHLGFFAKSNQFPQFPYPIVDPALGIAGVEEVEVLFGPVADLSLRVQEKKLSSTAEASRKSPTQWRVRWTE